jgi:hypothetical protein
MKASTKKKNAKNTCFKPDYLIKYFWRLHNILIILGMFFF